MKPDAHVAGTDELTAVPSWRVNQVRPVVSKMAVRGMEPLAFPPRADATLLTDGRTGRLKYQGDPAGVDDVEP